MSQRRVPIGPDAYIQLIAMKRHPADYRDEIEHSEVARILSELPEDRPARVAYSSGAREASDSLSMTHLLCERGDLVQRLVAAYLAHQDRIWARRGGGFRPQ